MVNEHSAKKTIQNDKCESPQELAAPGQTKPGHGAQHLKPHGRRNTPRRCNLQGDPQSRQAARIGSPALSHEAAESGEDFSPEMWVLVLEQLTAGVSGNFIGG